ncbi:hypothetical protein GALMADRAFT_225479 [Galerina marginata CBS 339.88]|uniref:Non-specific serine/threonine protein kinase n=1 Tax=Galerina marginata (strain CBS 339.88) TaxID=685588 RepID=A0A067T2B1_GALM3|nr:hypothetical protein GALMADRAFT_225479 [Galerina marginata CBS 339.88]
MVHGDLRTVNVMIKMKDLLHVDDGPEPILMVVDFDWADYELSAFYPAFINMDIPWSGKRGMQILLHHDAELVDKWWAKYPNSLPF